MSNITIRTNKYAIVVGSDDIDYNTEIVQFHASHFKRLFMEWIESNTYHKSYSRKKELNNFIMRLIQNSWVAVYDIRRKVHYDLEDIYKAEHYSQKYKGR